MALRDYITADHFNTPETGGMTGVSLTWNVNEGKEFPTWEDSNLHYYSNFDGSLNRTDSNVTKNSGDSFYPLILFYYNTGDVALANPNLYPFVYRIGTNTGFDYTFTTNNGVSWGWAHREGTYTTKDGNDIMYAPLITTNMASTSAVIVRNYTANKLVTFDTNIPIIITDLTLNGAIWDRLYNVINDYFSSGNVNALLSIINEDDYKDNVVLVNYDTSIKTEPKGEFFTIYNTGQRGTWKVGDVVTDVSSPYYRWLRVKLATAQGVDGRLAFYREGLVDGVIKLKPVLTADIVACEYSTNGSTWEEWTGTGLPFDYIYGEREDELGTFIYATRTGLNGTNGAPVFDDQATAEGWVNHDPSVDITDSRNYGDLGNRYPIGNKTGQKETNTTMGTASNFKSHFTQKYILDSGDVVKIANAMLDTTSNIFEDIVEGLRMFGESIIDSVCSLVFFPIDLTTVFTRLSSQSYIFFGGYQYPPTGDPTSIQVYKVTGYDGYIDLGTVTIEPTYPQGDYRNTSDYCRVSIFLPYIGLTELSYEKYVGKQLKVRYYIDLNTGSALVCLLCNDGDGFKLYDYLNGQIGAQIPITLTDASAYAQAELRNISNLASSITAGSVGLGTGIASRGSGIIQQALNGNTLGAVSEVGAMNAEGAVGAFSTGVGFNKAVYDLATTNINNFKTTKGSSGAIGNQYLPQYVYLVFEYIETEETPNLLQLEGRPSNKSGALESFSGYLEVDSVKLSCSYATENEKKEIEQLLNTGVYI